MNWYRIGGGVLASPAELEHKERIDEAQAKTTEGAILRHNPHLGKADRGVFLMSGPGQWAVTGEDQTLLYETDSSEVPEWIVERIAQNRVYSVNAAYPGWDTVPEPMGAKERRIHLVGLGDVGGILLTGLRLLGGPDVRHLGMFDPDPARIQRWTREIGQICFPFEEGQRMTVEAVELENLFDCDLFVFCASRSVPPVGDAVKDVRTVQYEGNAEILKPYVHRAVRCGFRGIFAVVSDPVDQLCGFALKEMCRFSEETGLPGMCPEQLRGYGLGVMNGRAEWYAGLSPEFQEYLSDGRAYGPHGHGLIVANSISCYDHDKSIQLTALTENANFEVRHTGFKPYVAPALSSGAISLLCTLRGQWHYSAVSLGGVFMGCKNRMHQGVQQTECLALPKKLQESLQDTYRYLRTWS